MRIDRPRIDDGRFAHCIDIATRFDDLDVQQHVNNVAVMVMLQEGRVRFDETAAVPSLKGALRLLVAATTVEYAAEIHYPAPVEVATAILAVGRTSFTLCQRVRQGGRTAIYAQTTMVLADGRGAVPIPNEMRAALDQFTLPPI